MVNLNAKSKQPRDIKKAAKAAFVAFGNEVTF